MTTKKGRIPRRISLEHLVQIVPDDGRERVIQNAQERDITDGVEHEKYVEVEYIAEPSLLSDPVVGFKLALQGKKGGFTDHQSKVIRAASRMRAVRPKNKIREVLKRHGFSRDYRWSKKNGFKQRMTISDATKLKSSPDGHTFRIIGEEEVKSSIILPQNQIRVTDEREMKQVLGYIRDPRKPNVRNA